MANIDPLQAIRTFYKEHMNNSKNFCDRMVYVSQMVLESCET